MGGCDSTLLDLDLEDGAHSEHWGEPRLVQETVVDWLLNQFVELNIGFVAKLQDFVLFCPLRQSCFVCVHLCCTSLVLLAGFFNKPLTFGWSCL